MAPHRAWLVSLALLGTCHRVSGIELEPAGAPPGTYPDGPKWVMGYYVGYQRELYPPEKVDFGQLTHLAVGRVLPLAGGGVDTTFDIDAKHGPELARDLSVRAHKAGRKALLMLGGAGAHDAFAAAASEATRAAFVKNLVLTLSQLGYDGYDLDWEPLNKVDRPAVVALAKALREAVPGILLTIPVSWLNVNSDLPADSWYGALAPLFDQINIMSYSMAGPWGWRSWHSSALTGAGRTTPTSVASSAFAYIRAGVPRAKLGVGIGLYGSCWTAPVTGPGQATGSSAVAASDNEMSFTRIRSLYFDPSARVWDAKAQVPFLSFDRPTGPAGCTFVSYEDEQSITAKAQWVKANGLGGVMLWTINQGYVAFKDSDPPLEAAGRALLGQAVP